MQVSFSHLFIHTQVITRDTRLEPSCVRKRIRDNEVLVVVDLLFFFITFLCCKLIFHTIKGAVHFAFTHRQTI